MSWKSAINHRMVVKERLRASRLSLNTKQDILRSWQGRSETANANILVLWISPTMLQNYLHYRALTLEFRERDSEIPSWSYKTIKIKTQCYVKITQHHCFGAHHQETEGLDRICHANPSLLVPSYPSACHTVSKANIPACLNLPWRPHPELWCSFMQLDGRRGEKAI